MKIMAPFYIKRGFGRGERRTSRSIFRVYGWEGRILSPIGLGSLYLRGRLAPSYTSHLTGRHVDGTSKTVRTLYGTFKMCETCAHRMPAEFLKEQTTATISVPTCPKCQREYTLILSAANAITCTKDAGGCGATYKLSEVAKLYKTKAVPE